MDSISLIDSSQAQLSQKSLLDPRLSMGGRINKDDGAFKIQAQKKAEEFEAIFIAQMFKPMMESIPTDGPLGGGNTEHMFRSMMIDEIGKDIAKQGGVGLSDSIYQEILKMQEV
jgi:peptidoglycan hydrolase FlgJ